ncbi:unnamed protein product, partial [Iphiclides podalirius]
MIIVAVRAHCRGSTIRRVRIETGRVYFERDAAPSPDLARLPSTVSIAIRYMRRQLRIKLAFPDEPGNMNKRGCLPATLTPGPAYKLEMRRRQAQ